VKLSVSLPEDDVAFVDEYARRRGASSRSSVVHRAIALLRLADLESAYADAWDEWERGDGAGQWDSISGDGIADAAR
jgi:Arc/MetJ-type ribon-helix-helix transcriptional regulator